MLASFFILEEHKNMLKREAMKTINKNSETLKSTF